MKIVVIGGTGLIGSKLVEKLRRAGHEPLAASPESGVDTYTGKGLEQALGGAQVVVDVSNAPAWDAAAVLDFFQTTSRNLLAVETTTGVSHHVALSVVGVDRLPDSGYFRGKLAQEDAVRPLPSRSRSFARRSSSSSSAVSPTRACRRHGSSVTRAGSA